MKTCSVEGCTSVHRARGLCSTHYNQSRYAPDQRHRRLLKPCVICRREVLRIDSERYAVTCSVPCRTLWAFGVAQGSTYDWTSDAMERARNLGATQIERIDRLAVFERDQWRCYLCSAQVHDGYDYTPDSATVDHVTPLTLGGQHTLSNVRTCCLSCNSSKGQRAA